MFHDAIFILHSLSSVRSKLGAVHLGLGNCSLRGTRVAQSHLGAVHLRRQRRTPSLVQLLFRNICQDNDWAGCAISLAFSLTVEAVDPLMYFPRAAARGRPKTQSFEEFVDGHGLRKFINAFLYIVEMLRNVCQGTV
jgi:hypothetical protein